MSTRSLELTAAGIPAKRGPAHRAPDDNRDGTVIRVPSIQTPRTAFQAFLERCRSGKSCNPLHRSPDDDTGRIGQ